MERRATPLLLLGLSGLGFAALGLPDGVLGVAWPSMRSSFGLPWDAVGALLLSTTAGYVVSSFASGAVLARIGVGALLSLSCLATAASLLGYALVPAWALLVALGCVAGLGAGAIDAGINTYAATHHSARTLGLLHACYGLGTATGPLIMTGVLMAGHPWRRGYAIIGLAQLALAAGFGLSASLWPRSRAGGAGSPAAPIRSTLRLRASQLGSATFFLYVGLEAIAGVWIFSLLHVSRGASMAVAGAAVSTYWGALMGGRLLLALAPSQPRSTNAILRWSLAGIVAAALLLALDLGGPADLAAAALLGLSAGPVFPCLVATTPRRLAAGHAANAVGVQVAAAALGQALLPAGVGLLADASALEVVPRALVAVSILLWLVFGLLDRTAPVEAPWEPPARAPSPAS